MACMNTQCKPQDAASMRESEAQTMLTSARRYERTRTQGSRARMPGSIVVPRAKRRAAIDAGGAFVAGASTVSFIA